MNLQSGANSCHPATNADSSGGVMTPGEPDHLQKFAVPRKLKGKTEPDSGSFGVMLVQFNRENEQAARGEAAKRTSEGTALAALAAQTDAYIPLSKRRVPGVPGTGVVRAKSRPPPTPCCASSSLDLPGIKSEQTRLLSLFQRLPTEIVVEQLARAVRYFGGMPDTPAPVSGTGFPEGAGTNGSGALLISWLSEIFPPVDVLPNSPTEPTPSREPRGKRARGRPKGSKNKKKDHAPPAENAADARGTHLLPDDGRLPTGSRDGQREGLPGQIVAFDSTATRVNDNEVIGIIRHNMPEEGSTPSGKKRGRPKGSKNRQSTADAHLKAAAEDPVVTTHSDTRLDSQETAHTQSEFATNKRKGGPGRPKGSKNKRPKEGRARGNPTQLGQNTFSQRSSPHPTTVQDVYRHGGQFRPAQDMNGPAAVDHEQCLSSGHSGGVETTFLASSGSKASATSPVLTSAASRPSEWWPVPIELRRTHPRQTDEPNSSSAMAGSGRPSGSFFRPTENRDYSADQLMPLPTSNISRPPTTTQIGFSNIPGQSGAQPGTREFLYTASSTRSDPPVRLGSSHPPPGR